MLRKSACLGGLRGLQCDQFPINWLQVLQSGSNQRLLLADLRNSARYITADCICASGFIRNSEITRFTEIYNVGLASRLVTRPTLASLYGSTTAIARGFFFPHLCVCPYVCRYFNHFFSKRLTRVVQATLRRCSHSADTWSGLQFSRELIIRVLIFAIWDINEIANFAQLFIQHSVLFMRIRFIFSS